MILLLLRNNVAHIVNYNLPNGYRTLCFDKVSKKQVINTIGADDTFPLLCKNCKKNFDMMKLDDLNEDPTLAFNQSYSRYVSLVELHRKQYLGPIVRYCSDLPSRSWKKLFKYKSLLLRKHK
jgi:hypothetical protein